MISIISNINQRSRFWYENINKINSNLKKEEYFDIADVKESNLEKKQPSHKKLAGFGRK